MVDGQQSGSPSRGFESPGRGFELTDRGFESLGRGLLDTPGAYSRGECICPVCDTKEVGRMARMISAWIEGEIGAQSMLGQDPRTR